MNVLILRSMPTLLLLALLSGCAGINDRFGCNATAGSSCIPVSEVNAQADIGFFDYQTSGGKIQFSKSHTFDDASLKKRSATLSSYQRVASLRGKPVRAGERIQRIWIAPYQDLENNYHAPSYVYTVLNTSHWIGKPVQEIKIFGTE